MEIEDRLKHRQTNEVHDAVDSFQFHARPVPKTILEGPVVSIHSCVIQCFLTYVIKVQDQLQNKQHQL